MEARRQLKMIRRSLFAISCLFGSMLAQAHPFHTSLTEIEYNQSEQVLEVAVRFSPVDLEEALTAYHGKTVVIDDSDRQDQMIFEYLRERLVFSDASSERGELPLHWVGKQLQIKDAWFFLTVPWAGGELKLANRLLLSIYPRQINTVSILKQGKKSPHQLTSQSNTLIFQP